MAEGSPGIPVDALRDYGRPVQVVSAVFYGTIADLNVSLLLVFKPEVSIPHSIQDESRVEVKMDVVGYD